MKQPFIFKFCIGIITILFFSVHSYGQVAKAEMEIRDSMKQLNVVGLAIAVVKNKSIIYANAFGLKNIESNSRSRIKIFSGLLLFPNLLPQHPSCNW